MHSIADVAATQGPGVAVLLVVWWDLRRTVARLVTRVTRLEMKAGIEPGAST